MEHREQLDALYEEISRVLVRFEKEFDVDGAGVTWVLQCLIHDVSNITLDFESDLEDENDDRDRP